MCIFPLKVGLEESGLPCQGGSVQDGWGTLQEEIPGSLDCWEPQDPNRQPVYRETDCQQLKSASERVSYGGLPPP